MSDMSVTDGNAPQPRKDIGARLFLRTVWARAYPRIIGQQREPTWIFFETFLPFLTTVGYVYVYRAIQAPEQYIGFAVMGGAMTAFWMNVMWSMSAQLYWDKARLCPLSDERRLEHNAEREKCGRIFECRCETGHARNQKRFTSSLSLGRS